MENSEFSTELLPGLPEELGLHCLSRLSYTAHGLASRVCHRWRDLLQRLDFYYHRKKLGYTQKVACLVLVFNDGIVDGPKKPGGSPSYGIAVFDSVSQGWDRLAPAPKYLNGLPLFCQLASCEGKLVVMGGWDPGRICRPKDHSLLSERVRVGFILRAGTTRTRTRRERVGYDLRTDEWSELGELSQERDECEGVVIGEDEFWVVSGYRTERQGQFDGSADVYGLKSGQWRRVEGVWEPVGAEIERRDRERRETVELGRDRPDRSGRSMRDQPWRRTGFGDRVGVSMCTARVLQCGNEGRAK
ncbi:Ureide permease 2 isoform 1 [Hibiscus syriacus]|uniref:Ureide permease 2 isoform 1 n=1 Tax=Hibiscus syriacus TaxID=106335 RepID=A0A6A3A044_HIBSY|nr:Ureide permease 2 isoform 1 [Hibiscus syriacus]